MTDPLNDLKAALRAQTPDPDSTRRAQTLARAQEMFDHAQGSAAHARPMNIPPRLGARFVKGMFGMFNTFTRPVALTATTALVAGVFFVSAPLMRDLLKPSSGFGDLSMEETAVSEPASPRMARAPEPTMAPLIEPPSATMSLDHAGATAKRAAPLAAQLPQAATETFANGDPNPVKITRDAPVSTFSIDVDTASYALVRQSIMAGFLPPTGSVRVEEMINYFPYDYAAPQDDNAFRPSIALIETPWNPNTRLLRIGLQGALPALTNRAPLNLVFLIDTSGSMEAANKLPLLIQSFRLMLAQLRPEDEVAIVTYAGSSGLALPPTRADDRGTINTALAQLSAGGSTAGQAGLEQAYSTAHSMTAPGEISRVILATDGDFNVGLSDPDALKRFIKSKRDSGTYLSVLGFGRGNLNDAVMQSLAQNGNGQAAYIDTLNEAQKVLVDQLTGALFPIADDVKIQIEFNPAAVAEYRLIGYETRSLTRTDFNNDAMDAGEIGAGHQVTALYEMTPTGSAAVLADPLRYGTATDTGDATELAFLRLRAKSPGSENSTLTQQPIMAQTTSPDADTQFAAAIAGFGQILRGTDHLASWTLSDAIALAETNLGEDRFGYRREAINLMRLAQSLKN